MLFHAGVLDASVIQVASQVGVNVVVELVVAATFVVGSVFLVQSLSRVVAQVVISYVCLATLFALSALSDVDVVLPVGELPSPSCPLVIREYVCLPP